MSDLIKKIGTILSGFVKRKEPTLPFEGIRNLPSEFDPLQEDMKENPISEEEALNRANSFIDKVRRLYRRGKKKNDGSPRR